MAVLQQLPCSGAVLARARASPSSWQREEWAPCFVPEALPAREGPLPHLHDDHEDRFPKAVACCALDDCDPPGEEGLEERGKAIGIELGASCAEKNKDDGTRSKDKI